MRLLRLLQGNKNVSNYNKDVFKTLLIYGVLYIDCIIEIHHETRKSKRFSKCKFGNGILSLESNERDS